MSAWLDALFGRMFDNDAEIDLAQGINFKGGLRATLNFSTKMIDVFVGSDAITPAQISPEGTGTVVPVVFPLVLTAGTPGTADDVTLTLAAPFGWEIQDVWLCVTTAIGGSTVRLFSAPAGGGTPLSSALSSASTGVVRNNDTSVRSVAKASSVYVRRTDRGVAGKIWVQVGRT